MSCRNEKAAHRGGRPRAHTGFGVRYTITMERDWRGLDADMALHSSPAPSPGPRRIRWSADTLIPWPRSTDGSTVVAGVIVSIRYEGDDEVERLLVGSVEERHGELEVLTPGSPLGVALMGHAAGDIVDFEAPGGILKVEIVDIDV